jgi:hypothetical protein
MRANQQPYLPELLQGAVWSQPTLWSFFCLHSLGVPQHLTQVCYGCKNCFQFVQISNFFIVISRFDKFFCEFYSFTKIFFTLRVLFLHLSRHHTGTPNWKLGDITKNYMSIINIYILYIYIYIYYWLTQHCDISRLQPTEPSLRNSQSQRTH